MNQIKWVVEPQTEIWGLTKVKRWETECETYRIYEVLRENELVYGPSYKDKNSWTSIKWDEKGSGYPKYYLTIEEAINEIEQFHLNRHELDEIVTNSDKIIKTLLTCRKRTYNKTELPGEAETNIVPEVKIMNVNRNDVETLLNQLKISFTSSNLEAKVNKLIDLVEVCEGVPGTVNSLQLMNKILSALRDGETIELADAKKVSDEEVAPYNGVEKVSDSAPKKRGRPKKAVESASNGKTTNGVPDELKKRGRPKKIETNGHVKDLSSCDSYNIYDVSKVTGLHPSRINQLIKSGQLKAKKDFKWTISRKDLEEFQNTPRRKPGRPKKIIKV